MSDVEAFGLENGVKGNGEFAVVVVDQDPFVGSLLLEQPDHLSCQLGAPPPSRICSQSSQPDSSRAQFDELGHIRRLQAEGLHREEVKKPRANYYCLLWCMR